MLQAEQVEEIELTPSLVESLDAAIKALKVNAEKLIFSEMTINADDGGVGRVVPEMRKDYARLQRTRQHIEALGKHRRDLKPY